MKTLLSSLVCSLLLILAGCATTPPITPQQIASADYGASPQDHEKMIRDYLFQTMIDPNSMMLDSMGEPFKAYDSLKKRWGYGVYFRLNGKNELGGYTGWQQSVAFMRDEQVLDVWEGITDRDGRMYGTINFVRKVE